MEKFSAKLLFQFRVQRQKGKNRRRWCEERMICFQASSLQKALERAKAFGRKSNFTFENADGERVQFEFVGVLDLLHLGVECEPEEVWYDILQRISPMERRRQIIPTDFELLKSRSERTDRRAKQLYPKILDEEMRKESNKKVD